MEKYKLTKTIRFKLEPKNISTIKSDAETLGQQKFDLASFVCNLKNFIYILKAYLFYQNEKDESSINGKITIKNSWLRQYAKQEIAGQMLNRNQTIGSIKGVSEKIKISVDDIDKIYADLSIDVGAELNERAKKAKTGLLIRRLATRNALPLLISLIEQTSDKNETGNLSIQLKQSGKRLQSQMLSGIDKYLPEQSGGLPIAKASFNYYTINKKSVDYNLKVKEQINLLSIDLERQFNFLIPENIHISESLKNAIKSDVNTRKESKTLLLGDAPMVDCEDSVSLRQILKNIKSEQKKLFSEFIQSESSTFYDLKKNNKLYLFNDISEGEFNQYKQKTNDIKSKAEQKNQCINDEQKRKLNSELQQLRKYRGSLINATDKRTKNCFKTYKLFANIYRNVAQKHGRILSTLNGIEKEQVESQLLKYWAIITEENNQHNLVLIPKERANECKKLLENSTLSDSPSATKVYWFESFTLRSLRKLCFGYVENNTGTNTFYPELARSNELKKYYYNSINFIKGEFAIGGGERGIIQFYKDVLASSYAQSVLSFPKKQVKDELINYNFSSLDEFQIALEKICYQRYVICSQEVIDALSRYGAQIFRVASLDLRNSLNCVDKPKQFSHIDKKHMQIWKYFWSSKNETDHFDIRLNPEITITYRQPKQSRIEKYGKQSTLYDKRKNNRYLYPQFTLVTTISEHSNTPTKVLSFLTDEEFKSAVGAFNTKFKKDDIRFSFGIDNGETELSTLGVYLPVFKKDSNEEVVEELKKVSEHGFKVLSIKDLSHIEVDKNGRNRKIIQNPSYFLNKEQYMRTFGKTEQEYDNMFAEQFEEKTVLTLDLTTAKVINGHIVTNGDVPTFFNLWMRHAQRNIWDMNDHAKEKTAKKITLKNNYELTDAEKIKFVEYLNKYPSISYNEYIHLSNKKKKEYTPFHGLTNEEREKYTAWVFSVWEDKKINLPEEENKFENVKNGQRVGSYSKDILFAVCYIGTDINSVTDIFDVRNVFKMRKDFYILKSETEIRTEIELYNTAESIQKISNEELDLKINHLKNAVVANAVGVIDFLYNYYNKKTGGDGLIVKEGFDTKKVAEGLERFSGNIYRILERKLYQKFQNYGLVPPIKSLMAVRAEGIKDASEETNKLKQLGNICFVSQHNTSKICPVCNTKQSEHKQIECKNCNFKTDNIMHSNDGIAGYNIAKRGFENFISQQKNEGASEKGLIQTKY